MRFTIYDLRVLFALICLSVFASFRICRSDFTGFEQHVFPLIRDTCSYVCPSTDECDGHQFLNFIETLYQFQQHAVLEQKCFFKDFRFYNFRFKKDNAIDKIAGWDFDFYSTKDLSRYTYSQRAQYLN